MNNIIEQQIEHLRPFIQQIISAPLPTVPGAGLDFYLGIESIRCGEVTSICANFIKGRTIQSTDDELGQLRRALDSTRRELLKLYPRCSDLLNPETWPENRKPS